MTESVKITRDAEIACVVLNRPQAFNAIDHDLVASFASQLITLATDPEVRGVVISGAGKAFCAGGDLKYFLGSPRARPGPSMRWPAISTRLSWRFAAWTSR